MLSVGGVRGGEMVCVGYDVVSWSISPLSVSDSIYQCPPPPPLIADLNLGPNRSKRVVSWGRIIYRVTWKVSSGKSLICSSGPQCDQEMDGIKTPEGLGGRRRRC